MSTRLSLWTPMLVTRFLCVSCCCDVRVSARASQGRGIPDAACKLFDVATGNDGANGFPAEVRGLLEAIGFDVHVGECRAIAEAARCALHGKSYYVDVVAGGGALSWPSATRLGRRSWRT